MQVYLQKGIRSMPCAIVSLPTLLDAGVDIHTIKELLGHSNIKTTMVYLHLQSSKRNLLVSPLDELYKPDNEIANIPKNKALL